MEVIKVPTIAPFGPMNAGSNRELQINIRNCHRRRLS
jgi:hypothetical protein